VIAECALAWRRAISFADPAAIFRHTVSGATGTPTTRHLSWTTRRWTATTLRDERCQPNTIV